MNESFDESRKLYELLENTTTIFLAIKNNTELDIEQLLNNKKLQINEIKNENLDKFFNLNNIDKINNNCNLTKKNFFAMKELLEKLKQIGSDFYFQKNFNKYLLE